MCSPFAVFISIRRINCYVICLLNYSSQFIWEESYISNITSFPAFQYSCLQMYEYYYYCLFECWINLDWLIELKTDMDTKRRYSENSLVDINKFYVYGNIPNLSSHAKKVIPLFGSSCSCVQFFKKMLLTKTRCRLLLIDVNLASQLRMATTSVKASIDRLCKNSKFKSPTKMVFLDKMKNKKIINK